MGFFTPTDHCALLRLKNLSKNNKPSANLLNKIFINSDLEVFLCKHWLIEIQCLRVLIMIYKDGIHILVVLKFKSWVEIRWFSFPLVFLTSDWVIDFKRFHSLFACFVFDQSRKPQEPRWPWPQGQPRQRLGRCHWADIHSLKESEIIKS